MFFTYLFFVDAKWNGIITDILLHVVHDFPRIRLTDFLSRSPSPRVSRSVPIQDWQLCGLLQTTWERESRRIIQWNRGNISKLFQIKLVWL